MEIKKRTVLKIYILSALVYVVKINFLAYVYLQINIFDGKILYKF